MWDDPGALRKLSLWLSGLALLSLSGALLLWAARQPSFAVHRIVFVGELKQVNPAHLEAVAREELRGTFFTLSLDSARNAFARVPWVRSASVRRVWPDELEVTLTEHVALARWNSSSNDPALVDTLGETFQADYEGELPAFDGPDGTAAEVTQRYQEFAPQLARIGRSVSALRLTAQHAWALTLDNAVSVELGRDSASTRLARFVEYYPAMTVHTDGNARSVDMRYRRGFVVRAPVLRQREAAIPKA